jgi:hypothetical protein
MALTHQQLLTLAVPVHPRGHVTPSLNLQQLSQSLLHTQNIWIFLPMLDPDP